MLDLLSVAQESEHENLVLKLLGTTGGQRQNPPEREREEREEKFKDLSEEVQNQDEELIKKDEVLSDKEEKLENQPSELREHWEARDQWGAQERGRKR